MYLCPVERGHPWQSAALEAVFEPVRPPTTFEETVGRLGTAIRLGLLPPGSRLPAERELAGRLRISRSTLRHALKTLVQSGHLVALRGRTGGTFVADEPPLAEGDNEDALGDAARARARLPRGGGVGSYGARSRAGGRGGLDRLDELTGRMARARRPSRSTGAPTCTSTSAWPRPPHSPRLVTAMTEVQGQMSELIARIAHPEEVLMRSNAQHRRIVELIRRRDAGRAVRLMREHMGGTEHILVGLMPPGR